MSPDAGDAVRDGTGAVGDVVQSVGDALPRATEAVDGTLAGALGD